MFNYTCSWNTIKYKKRTGKTGTLETTYNL